MTTKYLFLVLLLAATAFTASATDAQQESLNEDEPQMTTLAEGDGETFASKGQRIQAHYLGTLLDGTKFDSSYDRGQPFAFTLGVGQVIKCWDYALARMSVGQKVKVVCPSKMAYGSRGAGRIIPPNSDLIFEVELVAIE